jgi:heptosyltransferase-3
MPDIGPMRVLFITATRIGDAILSTGLIAHLLAAHPDARFTIACGPAAQGIFTHTPRLDRLIVVEKQRLDAHWLTLWWQVAFTRWDLVIDLRGSALAFTIPARRRLVMRGGRRPGHRLTHLAATLNLASPPLPVAWISPADHTHAASLIPGATPVIALGPTANWSGKIWPADRFVALYQALAATLPGARPAIFAGPGEAERAAAAPVLAALPNAIDLAGRLTLPQAAACLARCTLFIGNDSGLMHLAAATGTPTLGLFGPTPADEYAPAGPRTAFAEADGPPGATPMDRLQVATALAAAYTLLDLAKAAAA